MLATGFDAMTGPLLRLNLTGRDGRTLAKHWADGLFMRESLVWVIPLATEGLGLVAYTWVDAFGKAGVAGIAFGPRLSGPVFERVDEVPVSVEMGFDDWKAGPIHVALHEPLRSSHIGYAGQRLAMDFTFTAGHPPYAYSSHPDRSRPGSPMTGSSRAAGPGARSRWMARCSSSMPSVTATTPGEPGPGPPRCTTSGSTSWPRTSQCT